MARTLFDDTTQMLHQVMNLRQQKQQVIVSNVANAQTPGYSPVRMHFTEQLRAAVEQGAAHMEATHPRHLPPGGQGVQGVEPQVTRQQDRSGIGDGNPVDVNDEMMALSQNQILYEATTQMLNKKLGMLKYAATGGR